MLQVGHAVLAARRWLYGQAGHAALTSRVAPLVPLDHWCEALVLRALALLLCASGWEHCLAQRSRWLLAGYPLHHPCTPAFAAGFVSDLQCDLPQSEAVRQAQRQVARLRVRSDLQAVSGSVWVGRGLARLAVLAVRLIRLQGSCAGMPGTTRLGALLGPGVALDSLDCWILALPHPLHHLPSS